jgi:hypothetical protein
MVCNGRGGGGTVDTVGGRRGSGMRHREQMRQSGLRSVLVLVQERLVKARVGGEGGRHHNPMSSGQGWQHKDRLDMISGLRDEGRLGAQNEKDRFG